MVKALFIIDMIKAAKADTNNYEGIIKNQLILIDEFNKHKLPVIIVTGKPTKKKNPVMLKLWGNEDKENAKKGLDKLDSRIEKAKRTKLLRKPVYDMFLYTDLEKYCKKKKIDEIYLSGVYSGCCVYFSGAGATMRGIQPYLVTDAAGSPRKDLVSGGWNKNTLDRFKLMIGPLITTKELVKKL
jgi:isochorismate hydrolase